MPPTAPGELIGRLDGAGIYHGIKCQPPPAVKGHFPKDRFTIDLDAMAVTCPAASQLRSRQPAQTGTTPGQPGSPQPAAPAR